MSRRRAPSGDLAPLACMLRGEPVAIPDEARWWRDLVAAFPAAATLAAVQPALAGRSFDGREDLLARAKRAHLEATARGVLAAEVARQVAGELRAAGIPVAALKGCDVVDALYGGIPGRRPMADVDLLLREEDFIPATEILARGGARMPDPAQASAWREDYHAWEIGYGGRGIPVELHWGLVPRHRARVDMAEVWSRLRALHDAAPVPLGLHWLDLAWYLPYHAALHGMDELFRAVDLWLLARRLRAGDVDAAQARDVARRFGVGKGVAAAAAVFEELWGEPWPLPRPGAPPWLRYLARPGSPIHGHGVAARALGRIYAMSLVQGAPAKLRHLAHYARMKARDA